MESTNFDLQGESDTKDLNIREQGIINLKSNKDVILVLFPTPACLQLKKIMMMNYQVAELNYITEQVIYGRFHPKI